MIKLKRTFNEDIQPSLSTVNCALDILNNTLDTEIAPYELNALVAKYKNISVASVRGSLWGGDLTPRPHKLMGTPVFKRGWFMGRHATGKKKLIKIGVKTTYLPIKPTYDTPEKQKARRRGGEACLKLCNTNKPKILTMASEHAHDVHGFLAVKPKSIVYNVENNPLVFAKVLKLDLPMTSRLCDISTIVEDMPDNFFDLINYDTDGYASQMMDDTLKTINRKRSAKWVCVTFQDLKQFRNHGKFATRCREQYGNYDNPTMEYLKTEPMTNYKLTRSFTYNRSPDGMPSANMRTVVYRLKA